MKQKINRILIANRGEIAIRIARTCKEMGIETVGLYSEIEQTLPHVREMDFSICLGSGPLSETYLNISKIIQIAKANGVDAIHPGYGFLSENAKFCKEVKKSGIIFIGPPPEVIELMGDKAMSKMKMGEIGVPLIPGVLIEDLKDKSIFDLANKIGYPVLIKASAGGGGKGMRIVNKASELLPSIEGAKREALASFGDDRVLLEKYIVNPRHIEFQVMSDQHANHLHFFERDCSIQRRYQKIVEETPSPFLSPELRQQMGQTALKICRGIGYVGAGTIEFIVDENGHFFFLEMNTRLQVEHPITEMTTGLDLVALQVKVAEGEKLPMQQSEIKKQGHAIEVRIYSEDAENDFLPCTGKILYRGTPRSPGVRLDTGYQDGTEVTVHFDPMLAKLIAFAPERPQAIKKLQQALKETPFIGVTTNRDYLIKILQSQAFLSGDVTTKFIEQHHDEMIKKLQDERESQEKMAAALAIVVATQNPLAKKTTPDDFAQFPSTWDELSGFRNGE